MFSTHAGSLSVCLIAALANDRVIGAGNALPWHIPEDLAYFRRQTLNHAVVMGRRTFESIGSKPLPHRINIVVSSAPRPPMYSEHELIWAPTLSDAFVAAIPFGTVFVIGGASIYAQALPYADQLLLTDIHLQVPHGDAYFPDYQSEGRWHEVEVDRCVSASGISVVFKSLMRVSSSKDLLQTDAGMYDNYT